MEGAAKMASAGHHQHLDDAPVAYSETEMSKHGPIPYASDDCVVFLAEQVSPIYLLSDISLHGISPPQKPFHVLRIRWSNASRTQSISNNEWDR